MPGTTWVSIVFGPVIHVAVPSAIVPAIFSIMGASAEMITGSGVMPGTVMPPVVRKTSPLNATRPSRTNGSSTDRYSFTWRAGLS